MYPQFSIGSFDLTKHTGISASAGTGKTYNLIKIVEKILNNPKSNMHSIDNILIVTYTEKAVGELKSRIRKELGIDADNAPIYTIHAFCQNAIKTLGVSASLPLNLSLISESEIVNFADIYVRQGEILKQISKYNVNPKYVSQCLAEGAQKYYLNFSYAEEPKIISLTDNIYGVKVLKFAEAKTLADMCAVFPEIKMHLDNLAKSTDPEDNRFGKALEANYANYFKFDGRTFKVGRNINSTEGIAAYQFFEFFEETITKALDNLHIFIAASFLPDFYKSWQEEKEKNKKQSYDDMLRYVNETIQLNPDFKKSLQDRYTYGIIDEFQDTNYEEYIIFKNIFMEDDKHHLIICGDAKQSIFSFQRADAAIFDLAINDIKANGGDIFELTKNWRSTADMVDTCNQFFSHTDFFGPSFEPSNYLSKTNTPPDIYEHRALYKGNKTNAFWVAGNGDPLSPLDEYEFADIAVQQIIDCCSLNSTGKTNLQVFDGKGKRTSSNVSFRDFAVLAKTSSEMTPIMASLRKSGIPFIRYKDPTLFLGKECAHWKAIFEAINTDDFTGKNRKIFKKSLFTAFFGQEISEISDEKNNKDTTPEIALINQWKLIAKDRRWEDLIDDIIINSNLSKNMNTLKDIQSLAKYNQIGEYCVDVLSNGYSMDKLINTLTNLSNGGEDDAGDKDGEIIAKSTDFNCVQIMTIHASKGLEFPVVISVGGYKTSMVDLKNTPVKVFQFHNPKGELKLTFDKKNYESNIQDEDNNEWKRLFYVAYTRAQFVLILPFYTKYRKAFLVNGYHEFVKNTSAYRAINDTGEKYSTLITKSAAILKFAGTSSSGSTSTKATQDAVLKDLIGSKSKQSTYKHSYSSLSHKAYEEPKDPDDDTVDKEGAMIEGLSKFDTKGIQIPCDYDTATLPISFPVDYPRGTGLGTALHEIFEKIDYTDYSTELDKIIDDAFEAQGFGISKHPDWKTTTKEVVDNVLSAKLPVIHGSEDMKDILQLKSLPTEQLKREAEFNFNVFGQNLGNYCNGFVDLIFQNGEYFSILDWKSDRTNDNFESYSSAEDLKKHVDGHYSIQRVLYAYCLIKWLKLYYKDLGLDEEQIFQQHFGGVYYVFLRGCNTDKGNGIYAHTWNSWEDLKDSFSEVIHSKGGKK